MPKPFLAFLLRLIRQTGVPSPSWSVDAIKAIAPILIDWLQLASAEVQHTSRHDEVLNLLKSAFRSGDRERIYQLSGSDADEALLILLKAYDISEADYDEQETSQFLAETFRALVSKLESLEDVPSCFRLDGRTIRFDPMGREQFRGKTTNVYRWDYNGRRVAVKVLGDYAVFKQSVFRREIAIWRTLPRHKHVLPLLGFVDVEFENDKGEIIRYIAVVTPLLAKMDAETYFDLRKLSTEALHFLAKQWILEIARALYFLHSHGLIHGNISADNIFVNEHNHVRLGGFGGSGMSLVLGPSTGTVVKQEGRLEFQGPEQLSYVGPFVPTPATDIYAFACFCIQLFNEGHSPYGTAGSRYMWVQKGTVVKRKPQRPKGVEDDLWAIIDECLADDPRDRLTAEDLLARITKVCPEHPHDLLRYLKDLEPPSTHADADIFELLKEFAATRSLLNILTFTGSKAEVVMGILDQVLSNSYSQESPAVSHSSIRIELRPLLALLVSRSGPTPSFFQVTGVVCQDPTVVDRGLFGDVLRGIYDGKCVAVKRLRDPRDRKNLLRESVASRSLKHQHILPFIGVCEDVFGQGVPCLVFPWMINGNARLYITKLRNKQDPTVYLEVHKLLHQSVLAIDHLHSEGIVHADIHAANILVDEDKNARLADFGFARIDPVAKNISPTISGNPSWLAPELEHHPDLAARRNPTKESDIYSFGLVCIELYTCKDPVPSVQLAHIEQYVRSGLYRWIANCCNDNPDKRPTASELVMVNIVTIAPPPPPSQVRHAGATFTDEELLDSLW